MFESQPGKLSLFVIDVRISHIGRNVIIYCILIYCLPQYYQLKYGFHAVLADWQLAKLRPIFRVNQILS